MSHRGILFLANVDLELVALFLHSTGPFPARRKMKHGRHRLVMLEEGLYALSELRSSFGIGFSELCHIVQEDRVRYQRNSCRVVGGTSVPTHDLELQRCWR